MFHTPSHGLCQPREPVLRHGVREIGLHRPKSIDRRYVHDPPPPLPDHVRKALLDEQKRSRQIHGDRSAPIPESYIPGKVHRFIDRRAVNKYVHVSVWEIDGHRQVTLYRRRAKLFHQCTGPGFSAVIKTQYTMPLVGKPCYQALPHIPRGASNKNSTRRTLSHDTSGLPSASAARLASQSSRPASPAHAEMASATVSSQPCRQ